MTLCCCEHTDENDIDDNSNQDETDNDDDSSCINNRNEDRDHGKGRVETFGISKGMDKSRKNHENETKWEISALN